jgi:hypothetical protein
MKPTGAKKQRIKRKGKKKRKGNEKTKLKRGKCNKNVRNNG